MKVSHININTSSWKTKVNSLSSLLSPLVLQGNSLRLSSSSQLLQARWKELLCLSCCFCSHRSQTCQMWCRFLSPRDQDQQRDIMSVFSSSHSQSGCPECVCSPVCSDVMWRQQLDSVSSNSSQTSRSCCSCFKKHTFNCLSRSKFIFLLKHVIFNVYVLTWCYKLSAELYKLLFSSGLRLKNLRRWFFLLLLFSCFSP